MHADQMAAGNKCVRCTAVWPCILYTVSRDTTCSSRAGSRYFFRKAAWSLEQPINMDPGNHRIHTTIMTHRSVVVWNNNFKGASVGFLLDDFANQYVEVTQRIAVVLKQETSKE